MIPHGLSNGLNEKEDFLAMTTQQPMSISVG